MTRTHRSDKEIGSGVIDLREALDVEHLACTRQERLVAAILYIQRQVTFSETVLYIPFN